ncbi:tRNA-adenosine deaminase [Abditibacterium utsteinense]|uniref:tRNA-specific adenosine deaminase n=1 Tax=Abditibacterium utsteinense TaxID=1960156 RepID=A0A2S8SRZ7_9BACT|nr:tRNA adenosine(34) deaminase TadA [Abditibacterium utsteinense]PQV63592.1 tRNA-adenosine deaminase [Abditibacterium utsteinense]
MTKLNDEFWMREALLEARKCLRASAQLSNFSSSASKLDDVPIGAICVRGQTVVGRGHNRRELSLDPTAHAEILALQRAAQTLNRHNLEDVTLYVSLEPCPMCAGALWLSRVSRLVFGAWDEKAGACGSVFDVTRDPRLNHQVAVRGGVLENECAALLRDFFAARR